MSNTMQTSHCAVSELKGPGSYNHMHDEAVTLIERLETIDPEAARSIQNHVQSLTREHDTFEVIRQLHAANTVLKVHCVDYEKLSGNLDQCDSDIVTANGSVDEMLTDLDSLQAQSQWVGEGGEKAREEKVTLESNYLAGLGRTAALLEQKGAFLRQRCVQQVELGSASEAIPFVEAAKVPGPLASIADSIAAADSLVQQSRAELEPAVLETRRTIAHLLQCLAKEEEIVEKLAKPLLEAKLMSQAVVTLNASTVAGETPAEDALRTAVLKQEVKLQAGELKRAQRLADLARSTQHEMVDLDTQLEKLADTMEDLNAELMKTRRKKQDELALAAEKQLDALVDERRGLMKSLVAKKAILDSPELNRWYPEIIQARNEKIDAPQAGLRLFDRTKHINHFKQKEVLSIKYGSRVVRVEDSYGEWILKEMPRNKAFEQEALRLHVLAHPLVVHVECIFFHDKLAYVQMPYYTKGNLRAWTERIKLKQGKLSAAECIEVRETMKQLFQAVSFIHQNGVAHRDLKPENVLLQDSGLIAVCDFGCSRDLIDCSVMMMATRRKHLFALDAWSLGIILLELLSGKAFKWNPHASALEFRVPGTETSHSLNAAELDSNPWQRVAWSLAKGLLHNDPTSRPSMTEALLHEFFTGQLDAYAAPSPQPSPAKASPGPAGPSPMRRKSLKDALPPAAADLEIKPEKFSKLDDTLRQRRHSKNEKKKSKSKGRLDQLQAEARPHIFLRIRSFSSGGDADTAIRDMIDSFEKEHPCMESAFSVNMGNGPTPHTSGGPSAGTDTSTQRPLAEAVSNFFGACSHTGNLMFEQGSSERQLGLHYLPLPDAMLGEKYARDYQAVGRILAKCLLEGIPVPLLFSQAMHSFILGDEELSDDVEECITLVTNFDPLYARELCRTLVHRHATGTVSGLTVGKLARAAEGTEVVSGLPVTDVVTDTNKAEVGFTNADLAAAMHAQEYLDMDQVLASFVFPTDEWDVEQEEYRAEVQRWMPALLKSLSPQALRVLLARTTGSTIPPSKDIPVSVYHIDVIPRYVREAEEALDGELYLMPHSRSLYIPTYKSFQEFRSEFLSALDLSAYIDILPAADADVPVLGARAGGWYHTLEGTLVFGAEEARASLAHAVDTLGWKKETRPAEPHEEPKHSFTLSTNPFSHPAESAPEKEMAENVDLDCPATDMSQDTEEEPVTETTETEDGGVADHQESSEAEQDKAEGRPGYTEF
eukprot:gene2514-3261_t